jgi:hypothetical protein
MAPLLLLCGLVLIVVGTWRGYAAARLAVAPFVHESTGARLRAVALRVGLAVAWLIVAFYGLFLVSSAR